MPSPVPILILLLCAASHVLGGYPGFRDSAVKGNR